MNMTMIDRDEFIKKYHKRLLGAFNNKLFISRDDITIREMYIPISNFAEFYCPFYYCNYTNEIRDIDYSGAILSIYCYSMQIKDKNLIDINAERKNKIEKLQKNLSINIYSVPIATDIYSHKTLILDSNKTCTAIYRNYLENLNNIHINISEIIGTRLEQIVGDFIIVNRIKI